MCDESERARRWICRGRLGNVPAMPDRVLMLRHIAATLREKLTTNAPLEEVRAAYQKLEGMTFAIAEALYAEPPPDAAG